MLRPIAHLLQGEVSAQNCLENVATIVKHHRIQASPGYRAAARDCLDTLRRHGLQAHVASYPSTGRNWHWTQLMPQEWSCDDAELWLLGPDGARLERLAWYQEMNLAIIQRSCATPAEGVTAELALVENAEEASSWEGLDLTGKMVLVGNGDIHRMLHHAQKAGAVGLVTARMTYNPPVRPEGDLPDALQYTSFWWSEHEEKGWGFVLSTRQGERLKRMLATGAVKLWARVASQFYDGAIENVEAVIPGTGTDEVLVVAHLCHPKPSANDNATGPATAMEMARALQRLIATGQLAQPRRTIRFLLPPEMTGTFAHLASLAPAQRERIAAAVNLDMVGESQEQTGSVLLCEYPPMACPSFAGDLMALALAEVAREARSFSAAGRPFALFRHAVTGFSGGSDHYILADPTVGIPCPMLIQWPDRFYHTSADTIDKVDPAMMKRVAIMAGTYAYFAACAGPEEARWLATEMTALFPGQLHEAVSGAKDPEAMAGFRVDRKLADLEALRRLAGEEAPAFAAALEVCRRQVQVTAELELQRMALTRAAAADARSPGVVAGWTGEADLTSLRPRRRQPGPISLRHLLPQLPEAERASWQAFTKAQRGGMADHLCYWTDGYRTLSDICRLVELETGWRNDAWALGYMQLLARLELIDWV